MKKYICISFFLLLFSQCSATKDSKEIFLNDFKGTWKITDRAELWFRTQLNPAVTVAEGTIIEVSGDGSFPITGASEVITFTFVEIEAEGILAVYQFVHDTKNFFVGIGFGQKGDVLISSSTVLSADLVTPTETGIIFLIK